MKPPPPSPTVTWRARHAEIRALLSAPPPPRPTYRPRPSRHLTRARAFLAALAAAEGPEVAAATTLNYHHGHYYLRRATRRPDGALYLAAELVCHGADLDRWTTRLRSVV